MEYEWSSISKKHKFRNGNPCPCCPVCRGLDPAKVQGTKEEGHRERCSLPTLLKRFEE